MTTRLDNIREIRLEKLKKLRELGIDPYPSSLYKRPQAISNARGKEGEFVSVAGRIWGLRVHGNAVFADLKDESASIQLFFQKKNLKDKFDLLKLFDVGDFLGASGRVIKTKAGEISIDVSDFQLLSKSLRPPPTSWEGFKDIEERYRQRYADLLLNEEVIKVFLIRSQLVKELRKCLDEAGFLEVETPILQPIYGGAAATPFITHHKALDNDFYLRISDELYLKRLIVGGFEKVYEIGRDFRNEGIDRFHNPEFTALEFYWAYADYEDLMEFTQDLISTVVKKVTGDFILKQDDKQIDLTPPWPRITYQQAILKSTGVDIDTVKTEEDLLEEIKSHGFKLDLKGVVGYGSLLDEFYKKTTRPGLSGPIFLTDRPTAFVTLAKRKPEDPDKTASFQLLIEGQEIINAYNELNDPVDQAQRFRESEKLGRKGKTEHEAFDSDYIRALEYGMPPTAGWGMGIDRFVMILTGVKSIKDVILFPTLRPEK